MRNINVIIVLILMVCIAAQSAQSAPIMKVEPSHLNIRPGDEFAAISQPPGPFFISGYIDYKNGSKCNDPNINITNINTGHEWKTQTDNSENYFQIILVHSDDIINDQILQFTAISPDGSLSNTTNHSVSSGEINNGGFCINITLDRACGDVNDDGIINILDVRLLSNHVINDYSIYEWTGDVNQDKKVDEEDIQLLLSHVFNPVIYPLNCCCN